MLNGVFGKLQMLMIFANVHILESIGAWCIYGTFFVTTVFSFFDKRNTIQGNLRSKFSQPGTGIVWQCVQLINTRMYKNECEMSQAEHISLVDIHRTPHPYCLEGSVWVM